MLFVGLLMFVCELVHGLSRVDPLVSTRTGLIRGISSGNGYAKFLGVPYALVNESNPFGPSIPHPGYDDIYEAYESRQCPQVYFNGNTVGTLDCLSMNIYVPNIASSQNLLPVMVWIHGGAFIMGDADMHGSDPKSLLRHDVIVIGINYRVGPYGFMCVDHPEVSGNQGLKDQVLALRWINENIESFGGNARQITVFGQSAGGMSINLHLYSSYEELFQRAIIQSGPALTPLLPMVLDNSYPIKLAQALNFDTTDITEALTYLSNTNVRDVVKAASELNAATGLITPLTLPCVEKETEGIEHFLTEHPRNLIPTKAKTTSVIIGHNDRESSLQYADMNAKQLETFDFEDSLNIEFELGNLLSCAADNIRHFYIGDEDITENVKSEISDFVTDFQFGHPSQVSAKKLLNAGKNTVYRYVFSYSGGRNIITVLQNLILSGAGHGDELGYLFDPEIFSGNTSPEDQLVADRLITLWTNFAKYGDPTPQTSDLLPFKWEPITKISQPYLDFDSDFTLQSRPSHDRMAFWDLFYKVYRKYQK